jgi:hypothetical protein
VKVRKDIELFFLFSLSIIKFQYDPENNPQVNADWEKLDTETDQVYQRIDRMLKDPSYQKVLSVKFKIKLSLFLGTILKIVMTGSKHLLSSKKERKDDFLRRLAVQKNFLHSETREQVRQRPPDQDKFRILRIYYRMLCANITWFHFYDDIQCFLNEINETTLISIRHETAVIKELADHQKWVKSQKKAKKLTSPGAVPGWSHLKACIHWLLIKFKYRRGWLNLHSKTNVHHERPTLLEHCAQTAVIIDPRDLRKLERAIEIHEGSSDLKLVCKGIRL